MKCHEVMEYMQRSLDGDLDEQEQSMMQQHNAECTSCMQMFERLNRLSDELVNLPKVTPPFNIVDSILPKLEELDRQRTENRPKTVWQRLWQNRAYRTAGGALAASVVILLMVYGGLQWPTADNAENLNEAAAGQQQTMISSASSSSNDSVDMVLKSTAGVNDSSDSTMESSSVELNDLNVADQARAISEGAQPAQDHAGDSNLNPSIAEAPAVAPDDNLHQTVPEPENFIEPSPPLDYGAEEGERQYAMAGDASIDPVAGQQKTEQEDDESVSFGSSSISLHGMGLAFDHSEAVPSPRGTYAAFAEFTDSEMQMVILNKEGDRIYASPTKHAVRLTSLTWSETEDELSYTVTDGNVETSYTIQVENRVEIKSE